MVEAAGAPEREAMLGVMLVTQEAACGEEGRTGRGRRQGRPGVTGWGRDGDWFLRAVEEEVDTGDDGEAKAVPGVVEALISGEGGGAGRWRP